MRKSGRKCESRDASHAAAVTCTSTRMLGRAMGASTHTRVGLFCLSIHAFQTAFMAAKSRLMSLTHMRASSSLDLSVPAAARRSSTCRVVAG